MAGTIVEDYGTGGVPSSTEGMSSEQHCQSGDSIAEWRSCEQVENGTASTSPPYWDTDDEDDGGPKPSELYGRYTWKIENFSKINKRELRSDAFEVGGYKWYILIYPQGCDVCNHLSLFLCVANHDKLLPGWSHFAQFTIAVVNKDPKKSKYSDTLHRFWKKEHDWGWKKFMELSKVYDGFIVADALVIKAQVQVISFRAFWLGIDPNARRHMSRDKTDAILKVVVKHFFIEKEVTSTLVMDSLYSGLKALECLSKNKKGRAQLIDLEELPAPMVHIDKDMFVLADDVLLLLERAVLEPFPHQPLPPKDDKSTQNRTKDGSSGEEFNKDSMERDEWRLSELGRRAVEIFVLAHIFSSRIEVSYQEAVALKRQEELIREEEAAGQAENELRAKRGAAEKEKRAKKKQEEVVTQQKKVNVKDQVDVEKPSNTGTAGSSSSSSPGKKPPYIPQHPKQSSETTAMASATTAFSTMTMAEPVCSREPPSSSTPQSDKPVPPASRSPKVSSISKSEASRHTIQAKSTNSQVTAMSRPSSAPLIPAARPTAPIVSTIQTVPLLSRSVSAACRLGADPSPSAPSYLPQSYQNAIMGKITMGASPASFAHHPTSSGQGVGYSQAPSALVPSASVLPAQNSARKEQSSARPGFIFGSVKLEALHARPPWKDDCSCPEPSSCGGRSSSNVVSDIERLDIYGEMQAKHFASEIPSGANSYQAQGVVADEFPHLDIINDLLDDEQSNGKSARGLHHHHHHHQSFSRQYSFPGNASAAEFGSLNGSCRLDQNEHYGAEGFRRVYGSSNSCVHGLREGHFSQVDLSAYANGQIDGVMQNQWLYGCTDLSMLNLGAGDANGNSYELPEYSNLADGVNGYMYRPANGP
ncbi:hypothetical protein COCNU_scaffold002855G000040 [Cocos nucifera]|nr:hypothetical protein [Cocos nucifera]